eukprot:s1728_g2.t1
MSTSQQGLRASSVPQVLCWLTRHWATWAFSVQLHEGCGSSRAPADARQAFVETGLRDVEQAGSFPRGWTGCYRMRSHFVVCDNQTDLSVDSSW